MVDVLDEIRVALKNDKVVFGSERVLKMLKTNSLSKVCLSKNVSDSVSEDINNYASISGIAVEHLKMSNEELGTFCKRKHFISILGIMS